MLSSAIVRSQAIPMAQYRRRVVFNHIRPYTVIVASLFIIYRLAVYVWGVPSPLELVTAQTNFFQSNPRECTTDAPDCIIRPELTSPDAIPQPPPRLYQIRPRRAPQEITS